MSAIGGRCRFRRNPIMGQNDCVRAGGMYIREPSSGSRVCYIARDREQCEEADVKDQCIFEPNDRYVYFSCNKSKVKRIDTLREL